MLSQCAIPAFEGLLPEPYNTDLMTLLYRLAEWHALAKLRMHTDSTLNLMESVTTKLGQQLRKFRDTTSKKFVTVELPKEVAAQKRRQSKALAKKHASSASSLPMGMPTDQCTVTPAVSSLTDSLPLPLPLPSTPNAAQAPKRKMLNLFTYKFHALADYVNTIRLFGTTDSYSTQTVSFYLHIPFACILTMPLSRENLSIGEPKRLYGRTNKNHAIRQMTRHERRETRLLRARAASTTIPALASKAKHSHATTEIMKETHMHHVAFSENEPLRYVDADTHHHISDSRKHYQDAFSFAHKNPEDPATKVSHPHLHLRACIQILCA